MSSKNFMAYGDAETVLTGFSNEIKDNDRKVYRAMDFNGVHNLAKLQFDGGYDESMKNITYTYNNGEVTLSAGTASGQSYSFPALSTAGFELEADRNYILTGVPANPPEGVSLLLRYNNGSNVIVAKDEGEGATFNFTSAMKAASDGYHLMINVTASTVIPAGGIVIKPMIRYAEDNNATFEKHVPNNRELSSGKADKVASATSDNFAKLDANGNLADSGYSANSFMRNVYLEQTATLSTSTTTTVTFTDSSITTTSVIDLAVSEWGLTPDDVTVTTGVCTVTMPIVDSAHSVTVRIYVR